MNEIEIHRGQNHRVFRVVDPVAGPLIVKRASNDGDALAARCALDNEQRILKRLQGLADCPWFGAVMCAWGNLLRAGAGPKHAAPL